MNCPLFCRGLEAEFPLTMSHLADGSGSLFQVLSNSLPLAIVVGQFARPMEHGQMATDIAMHAHLDLDVMAAMPIRWNLQDQFLETHTVVGAHRALVLLAQDVVEMTTDPWDES